MDFFAEMATEYGHLPNIIYEPFNEPEQLSWADDVKPYHEAVVAKIREIDPDNLIVLGTPNWSQYVDVAAAQPLLGANLLYTLHFYSCTHTGSLRQRADTALSMGLPLFVTEWGSTHADGGLDGQVCLDEAKLWTDWMGSRGISWTAWKLDNCTDSSCYFAATGVPANGGWTDAMLQEHGRFVRDRMRD
jgi:endoglucanase